MSACARAGGRRAWPVRIELTLVAMAFVIGTAGVPPVRAGETVIFEPDEARESGGGPVALVVPAGPFSVGDRIKVEAEFEPRSAFSATEVPESVSADLAIDADLSHERPTWYLQAFRTGEIEIPPLSFLWKNEAGETMRGHTAPTTITIASVLTEDDSDVPAGLDPPAEIAFPRDKAILLAILTLASLAVVAALVRGWLRTERKGKPAPAAPRDPADVRALAALDALVRGGTLDRGEVERFHVELSVILRRYFQERYRIAAVEHTTAELDRDLRDLGVDRGAASSALDLLASCDGVKFARERPSIDACLRLVEQARAVVDRTRPAPPIEGEGAATGAPTGKAA